MDDSFLVLQSSTLENGKSEVATQLWVQLRPFQISAIQPLETIPRWGHLPRLLSPENDALVRLPELAGRRTSVVWQTKVRPIRYQGTATILSLEKPDLARYLGWGEQAGTSLFKDNVMMNYFSKSYWRLFYFYSKSSRLRQYGVQIRVR